MKNTVILITGIALIYGGVASIIGKSIHFANIGLILIGSLMVMYFLWKTKTV
jgi:hypothetical protein